MKIAMLKAANAIWKTSQRKKFKAFPQLVLSGATLDKDCTIYFFISVFTDCGVSSKTRYIKEEDKNTYVLFDKWS